MPLAPPTPVMHLVVDPEEYPMDDEEHAEAEDEQVPEQELVQPVPKGTQPIIISTQPRIIRTAIVPRGRPRGDGASSSRASPMTSEDRSVIRE